MKKSLSLFITLTILAGLIVFPASVSAAAEILNEQFASPYPYTADLQQTANVSPIAGATNKWMVLSPESVGYPAGGTDNVLKIEGATGQKAYYNLPLTVENESVGYEIRFYWAQDQIFSMGFGDNLARLFFNAEGGYAYNDSLQHQINGMTAGWHQLKFVNVADENGVYNTFDVYQWDGSKYVEEFKGYVPRYSSSDQVKVSKLFFEISTGSSLYVDWIRVCREETDEVTERLEAPSQVTWTKKAITWTPVSRASAYEVILYCGDEKVAAYTVDASVSTYNFGVDFSRNGDGVYWAEVIAKGTALSILDSNPTYSDEYNYIYVPPQVLSTPSKPTWFNTVLKWDLVDNATGYIVTLYRGGVQVHQFVTTVNAYNAEMELFDLGDGSYTANIIAKGDGGDLYADSLASAQSDAMTYKGDYEALTVFMDTFDTEGYSVGDMIGNNDGMWSALIATENTEGLYSLVDDGPTGSGVSGNCFMISGGQSSGCKRSFSATGTLVFGMKLYVTADGGVEIRILNSQGAPTGHIINNGSNITVQTASSNYTVTGDLKTGQWNDFKIILSMSEGGTSYDTMSIELNGEVYTAATRIAGAVISSISFAKCTKQGAVYIDNFSLSGVPVVYDPEPSVGSIRITGSDLGYLTGEYSFYSAIGTVEGDCLFAWYKSNAQMGTYTVIPGAQDKIYRMADDEVGKWFKFEVTPVDHTGIYGETVTSEPYMHRFKPSAQNVCYTDDGIILTGSYVYTAFDNFREGSSKYRWLYCDTKDGQYIPIAGETGLTYTPTPQMRNKYIKFEVTPVTIEGVAGEVALSLPNPLTAAGKELMLAAAEVTMETISSQKNTSITQDLSLPDSIDGIAISWSSTDTSVVTTSGKVIQPKEGGNKYVTLTMTMEKDGETFRKSFKLCVPSQNPYGEIFDTPVESLFLTVNNTTFRDVTTADWFYADVMWAVSDGWFVGVSADLFDPEGLVTLRMAQILKSRYDGVTEPAWEETPYITRAEFLEVLQIGTEVLKGDENGDLLLDKTLTRAEACAILHRIER